MSSVATPHRISLLPSDSTHFLRPKPLLSSFLPNPRSPRPHRRGVILRVSAALPRGLRPRRNPLREKLLVKEAQLRRPPKPLDDPHDVIETHQASNSALGSKLENWVEQYKADNDFWGVGTGPIFTVFRDQDGNVVRVAVDEDEIVRRNWSGADAKILQAKAIAEDIMSGKYAVPTNSSVVKFADEGKESGFFDRIRLVVPRVETLVKLSPRMGLVGLCGCTVFWVARSLWSMGERKELNSEEKEMVRRKLKARERREMTVKGSVEVIQDDNVFPTRMVQRPELDREELKKDLAKAGVQGEVAVGPISHSRLPGHVDTFEHRVKEIREMARKARESERKGVQGNIPVEEVESQLEDKDIRSVTTYSMVETPVDAQEPFMEADEPSCEAAIDVNEKSRMELNAPSYGEEARDASAPDLSTSPTNFVCTKPKIIRSVKEAREFLARRSKRPKEGLSSPENSPKQITPGISRPGDTLDASSSGVNKDINRMNGIFERNYLNSSRNADTGKWDSGCKENSLTDTSCRGSSGQPWEPPSTSDCGSPSVVSHDDITDGGCTEFQVVNFDPESCESYSVGTSSSQKPSTLKDHSSFDVKIETLDVDGEIPLNTKTEGTCDEEFNIKDEGDSSSARFPVDSDGILKKSSTVNGLKGVNGLEGVDGDDITSENHDTFSGEETSAHLPDGQDHTSRSKDNNSGNWMEENFHEFEPIVQKIGEGFRENYAMAKEKKQEQNMLNVQISELDLVDGDDEIEWMKDESLKEIVFKVRENELAGKDPFYLMSADDQQAFFKGLEKKAENMNTKLSALHEWIHSRVENIDYGADGISLYDSPEKIMPRWKGPSVDSYPEFLTNSVQNRQVVPSSKEERIRASRGNHEVLKSSADGDSLPISVDGAKRKPLNEAHTSSPTLIECSDGSSRAGKKGGKEQWEHTKKWSREFLEIYNAETDPEVKSVMKDMGKDLDKWITNKEVEDVANLMDRIPKKKRRYIQKKLDKLKREMETFGPQAVVSKYREYSEVKEEDYLWWLDLKFVLCIEIYTIENDSQKVGFYSLEMAPDLELDPKQFHVIAFEDPGDSKNFCYILQTHLEMLGNGSAFVVARPPKDAFREAKANGFHVTVIRRGELKFNIDQTLEEVEEEITEIGSKIYHDKIMRDRSVDMGALTKGVFASERSRR